MATLNHEESQSLDEADKRNSKRRDGKYSREPYQILLEIISSSGMLICPGQ